MTDEVLKVAGEKVAFDESGLVPVVAQDETSGEVLMLAYANREALQRTLDSGRAHYFSRSRGELWRKGDSSGHVQHVSRVAVDCDGDALIYFVRQVGAACHTGQRSCFYRSERLLQQEQVGGVGHERQPADGDPPSGAELQLVLGRALALLETVVDDRLRRLPEGSYVSRLHGRGLGYMAQKVVEEAGETVVAALERHEDQLTEEAADLLFHLTVLLQESGQSLATVAALLESRHRVRSGEGTA